MSIKDINIKRYLQHAAFIQMSVVKIGRLGVQSHYWWSFGDCSNSQ